MASTAGTPSDPKKTSSALSSSPPTTDPENPFIAFRRFADSQISSVLQSVIGIPSLFSPPDSSSRWSSIDDFVAKRREAMVRARREFIDELERDMWESLVDKDDTTKRQENEMQKWGAFLGGSNAGRPKEGQGPDMVTAMKDHEKFGWDGKQRTRGNAPRVDDTKKDRNERFIVSTSEGKVNLNRVVDRCDEGQGFWVSKDDARLRFNTIQDQDPFSNPDQAIAWLLTDDYSPLYLDQTLNYKLHPSFYKSDADDSYFRGDYQPGDLYPRFAAESIMRHDPRLASKVDWRAAFHDLTHYHNKGYLLPPSHQNALGKVAAPPYVGNWISHLVDTGSLGSRWCKLSTPESFFHPFRFRYGNSSEAWAVLPFIGQSFVRDNKCILPLARFGIYERKNDALSVIRALSESTDTRSGTRDQVQKETFASTKPEGKIVSSNGAEALEQLDTLHQVLEDAMDGGWPGHRLGFTKAAIWLIRNPETEQATLRAADRVLRTIENPELEDEVELIVGKALNRLDLNSPNIFKRYIHKVDQALHDEHFEEWREAKRAVDSAHPAVYGISLEDPEPETSKSSSLTASDGRSSGVQSSDSPSSDSQSASFSSSSSAYSYKTDFASTWPANSIISTLTTVESRTLPDGSIETKRVLKKKFGDGREESSEVMETQSSRQADRAHKPVREEQKVAVKVVPEPPSKSREDKTRSGGGWFWN
jgi:hypothetical protein